MLPTILLLWGPVTALVLIGCGWGWRKGRPAPRPRLTLIKGGKDAADEHTKGNGFVFNHNGAMQHD